MKIGWVYIITNRPNGTLYTGVTADIVRRVHDHRAGQGSAFAKRYRLVRLVWFEAHEGIEPAIRRETAIKGWLRAWKARLIGRTNEKWVDLYETLL
jgi:putative endonuclease